MLELEVIDIKRTGIIVYLHFSAGRVQSVLLWINVSHQLIYSLCQLPQHAPHQQPHELPSSYVHLPRPLEHFSLDNSSSPHAPFPFLTVLPDYFSDFSTCNEERPLQRRSAFCYPKSRKACPKVQVILGQIRITTSFVVRIYPDTFSFSSSFFFQESMLFSLKRVRAGGLAH